MPITSKTRSVWLKKYLSEIEKYGGWLNRCIYWLNGWFLFFFGENTNSECFFNNSLSPNWLNSISGNIINSLFVRIYSVQSHALSPAMLLCPQDSPSKNPEVSNHSLLQGIFQIQGLNPGLLHFRHILYRLRHQGSPVIKIDS